MSVLLPGQTAEQKVGQINVTSFVNPAGLKAMGGNLFQATSASGQPQDGAPGTQGLATINSGSLEASNVDTVEEIVKMIIVQRAYDFELQGRPGRGRDAHHDERPQALGEC